MAARRTCGDWLSMQRINTRRNILVLLAGLPLLAAGKAASVRVAAIARLIGEAKALPRISQRIDFISRRLLGAPYRANTLVGGPRRPEEFVVRDDAFDCVTFCEVVLAAAMSQDIDQFETALRRIRYDHGNVRYAERNHYFADWCKRNVENGVCRPVAIEPSRVIDKVVTWHREFGRHRVSIAAIATPTLLENTRALAAGDIIGFASQRASLDYYHTGLIAFGKHGELMLRSASRSRGRVVEDRMATFVSINPVKYVTVLRAVEPTPIAERI